MVLELQRPVTRSENNEEELTVDFTRRYTLAEFEELELPETDDEGDEVEYELIKGFIVAKKSGPGAEHGAVMSTLATMLNNFAGVTAGENKKGRVFTGSNSNLGIEANVIPDLCFVLDERMTTPFTGSINVAPDIIAEINSPTDTTERIQEKIEQY
jgi:Uma2 family endonuclease